MANQAPSRADLLSEEIAGLLTGHDDETTCSCGATWNRKRAARILAGSPYLGNTEQDQESANE